VDELVDRLKSGKQKRPLLMGTNPEALRDFIEISLKKREPYYNRASLIIDVQNCSSKKEMNLWVDELLNNFR
jgi:shikimate kinase